MNYWMSEYPLPADSGIYIIYFDVYAGKTYVGSTTNFRRRFAEHKYQLSNNVCGCSKLQNAYNKHFESFGMSFHILERCSANNLREREMHFIHAFGALDQGTGYNIILDSDRPMQGRKMSSELVEANRIRNTGAGNGFYGKHHSISTRTLLSNIRIGTGLGDTNKNSRCVIAAKDGKVVGFYTTIKSMAEELHLTKTKIHACLNGELETTKGYSFLYVGPNKATKDKLKAASLQ